MEIYVHSNPPIIMPLDNIVHTTLWYIAPDQTQQPLVFENLGHPVHQFICGRRGAWKRNNVSYPPPPLTINHRVCYSFTSLPTSISQRVCQVFVRSTAPPHPPIRLRLFVRRFWRESGVIYYSLIPSAPELPCLRTHFLFEVNHVEVYNNIKFPFTRFVGSALFLRQKTHSLYPTAAAALCIYLLSRVTSTAMFFCTECVWFRFFSFSFLVRLIISTIPLNPPTFSSRHQTSLNDLSSRFVGATVHYLCCVCPHLYTVTVTIGNALVTHPSSRSHSICILCI